VKLDGHRVTVPSLLVAVGDKITLAKKDAILYDEVVRPSWIKVNEKELIAQVAALPVREEIGAEINESMVVEFYSR